MAVKNGAMGVKFCVMIVHYCVIKLLVINAIHSTFESLKQKLKTMKQKLFFVVFMMLGIGLNAYSSITSFNCYDGGRKLVEVVLNSPWKQHNMSETCTPPQIFKDAYSLYISSSCTFENLEVVISDMAGSVMSTSTISVFANVEYVYSIIDLLPGSYKVELKYGENSIYGYFTVNAIDFSDD